MTVEVTNARVSYAGDGISTSFSVPFYFLQDSHVAVWKRAAYDSETQAPPAEARLELNSGYALTGAGNTAGGTLALADQLLAGERITIIRDVTPDQPAEFPENGPFPAATVEEALDKGAMFDQQLLEQLDRTIVVPVTVAEGFSAKLPDPTGNAGKLLGFNSIGDAIVPFDYPTVDIDALQQLALSNTSADASIGWIDGTGMGVILDEFRYFIGGDTSDSLRVGRGDVRVRSASGAASLRLRRTEVNSVGNNLASITMSGTIATTAGSDERKFARIRAIIVDDNETTQKGGLQLILVDGYAGGEETEKVVVDIDPSTVTLNARAAYSSVISPSDPKDLADLEAVEAKIAGGVGSPYPIPVSFVGAVADGTYVLMRNVRTPFRIESAIIQAGAGTGTVTFQRDGGNITSMWNLTASTTELLVPAPTNTTEIFNEAREFAIVISNASGLTDLNIDIKAVLI